MSPRIALLLSLLGISLAAPAAAQSPFAPKVTGPLSQRVVAYQIDANYDPPKHTVDASETLTYKNLTGQPQDTFPFHLYLNAFQPKSTWMHEAHRDGNFRSGNRSESCRRDALRASKSTSAETHSDKGERETCPAAGRSDSYRSAFHWRPPCVSADHSWRRSDRPRRVATAAR